MRRMRPASAPARVTLFALACALPIAFAPAGCSRPEPPRDATQTRQSAVATNYTIRVGTGVSLSQTALLADGSLLINDRVKIRDANNKAMPASNSGTGTTRLGVESRVGTLTAQGSIDLADRSRVEGDVQAGGQIRPGNQVTVTGQQRSGVSLAPFSTETITIDFGGPSSGDVSLEPPPPPQTGERVTDLAPGTYGRITIKSRNRVNLRAGVYNVNELTLEPQARFVLDDAAGAVLLNVKTNLLWKGAVQSLSGAHPAFRLAYVGTNAAVIETAFAGTLIAPFASIRLATVATPHVGAFYAKHLEVSPDCTVIFKPYIRYEITETASAPYTEFGGFGRGATLTSGAVVMAKANAFRVTTAGVVTPLSPTPTPSHPTFDPLSGRWGYATAAGTFKAFRADGSAIGEYSLPLNATAGFVPGAEKIALMLASADHEGGGFNAVRIITTSNGSTQEFAADRLQWGQGTADRFVYSSTTELVATNHAGAVQWRKPVPLRDFIVAANGRTLVGVRDRTGSTLVHVDIQTGATTGEFDLPAPAWDLAASPSGVHTLAAVRNGVLQFANGAFVRRLKPGIAYFASADINDAGEIVLGAKLAGSQTQVMVIGPFGTQAAQLSGGAADDQGFRPFVLFAKGSPPGFFAVRKGGIASYSITRKL